MTWIQTIPYEEAEQKLKKIYDRVKSSDGKIDNVLSIHSLRPHSLIGHMTLYKNVLHNVNNKVPKWVLEMIGVYVSYLNGCEYCVEHHFAGLSRLLNDPVKSSQIRSLIPIGDFGELLAEKWNACFIYAKKLSLQVQEMEQSDVQSLREAGLDDGEILEINQVISYFNYVNRTVLGLGVTLDGDTLGLSPNDSDDASNWSHS